MRLAAFYNTCGKEIESKKWNIYMGISIQNKSFTEEYLREYLRWAAAYSQSPPAVVIVDTLQRINNAVFDRSTPVAALSKAFRKADEVLARLDAGSHSLPPELRGQLRVLDWCDIMEEEYFIHNSHVFRQEFNENPAFRAFLQNLTAKNLGSIVQRLSTEDLEHLSHYILGEMPELITGFMHGGVHYNLNVYPGPIFHIYRDLCAQDFWPGLKEKLRFIGDFASVEAYDI